MSATQEQWLSINDLAKRWHCSQKTVRRIPHARLHPHALPGGIRYRLEDVRLFETASIQLTKET